MWAKSMKRKNWKKANIYFKTSLFLKRFEHYKAQLEKEGKSIEDSKSIFRDFKKQQELKEIEEHD